MRIHEVEIENFRGIARLSWRPLSGITAFIGPGDSGKTTILDALGLLFSPRWNHTFTDNDFHGGKTSARDIVIRATVVDPPKELLRLEAFAGYTRGVNPQTGAIVDEPNDEDPALTVELRVDRTLEPLWQVVADRQSEPAQLRANHRAVFGVARIGGDSGADLRWSRNSALLRMTGVDDRTPTVQALLDATRAAKEATSEAFTGLDSIATKVTTTARMLRAINPATTLTAEINADSFQLNEGAVSLHSRSVPMERHGLGTRRLTGTAVQLAESADARVLLVDEVESGLEPHRIRHLIRALETRLQATGPLSHVFMTTHSPVVLRELTHSQLGVVRYSATETRILTPAVDMQGILRANPESFLASSVLVCEGATEVGFSRGVYSHAEEKDNSIIAAVGHANAGGETKLIDYASAFSTLGYRVAIFCDHDTNLDLSRVPEDIPIIRCDKRTRGRGNCLEQQIADSLGPQGLKNALQHGVDAIGEESVIATFNNRHCSPEIFHAALIASSLTSEDLSTVRFALGMEAGYGNHKQDWFKSVAGGEHLADLLIDDPGFNSRSPGGRLVLELEEWGAWPTS